MRHFARLGRLIAVLGCAAGIGQSLFAQEDLPPEFLRAHALVVRFLASSFELGGQDAAKGGPGATSPVSSGGSAGAGLVAPGSAAQGLAAPGSAQSAATARPASAQAPSAANPAIPVWTTVARRYTVTGAPVAIRLSGANIVIVVQVTPYDRGKEGLQVVAQGQVWSREADGAISYHSAFESLNVGFGEPVYFFPLGIKSDGTAALKVEIAIDHFGDLPSIPDPPSQTQSATGTKGR